jgi:hypothetical protein
MHIGTAIVVVVVLYLLVVSPGFRKTALIACAVAGVGIYLLVMQSSRQSTMVQQPAPPPQTISVSEIGLSMSLQPSDKGMEWGKPFSSYQHWMLDGTVTNNSASTAIDDLKFEAIVKDGSRIIAQETTGLCPGSVGSRYTVPAGQARTFHSCALDFKNMPVASSPILSVRLVGINGYTVDGKFIEFLTPQQRQRRLEPADTARAVEAMYQSDEWKKNCREQPGFDLRPDGTYDGSCPGHPRGVKPQQQYVNAVGGREVQLLTILMTAFSRGDLESLSHVYSDDVVYYGKRMPKSDVMADKRKFMTRWPTRNYVVRPDSVTGTCGNETKACVMQGVVDWEAANSTKHSTGVANFIYTLEPDEKTGLRVTEESSTVVSRSISGP